MLADLSGEPEVGEVVRYPDCGSDDYAHLHGKEADEAVQYPDHIYWDEWCDEDEDWYVHMPDHILWPPEFWADDDWYDACDDEGVAAAGTSMSLLGPSQRLAQPSLWRPRERTLRRLA